MGYSEEHILDEASTIIVRCESCVFWEHLSNRDGLCRRHAPNAARSIDEIAHWPLTYAENSCGEGLAVETSKRRLIDCQRCIYWRHPAGGIDPMQRSDQLAGWWREAGHCVRFAPRPFPEPGGRAFWRVSHAADSCFDGQIRHD